VIGVASKIVSQDATTFTEVVDIIEQFQNDHGAVWYRGCGDPNYKLQPTIYRHPTKDDPQDLLVIERKISVVFSQKSPPFVGQPFGSPWDKMFFMQHYGVPTRLLDWTESPFIALYFALTSCPRNYKREATKDAVVWLLDPITWNQNSLNDIGFAGGIIHPEEPQIKGYSPDTELDERRTAPIMIYGTYNSSRIVAQRGIFALFGKSPDPMERQYNNSSYSPGILQKVRIPKASVDSLTTSLLRKGITESAVFPDLTGLSLEIRREFGF
jgi:hypothetical protein